MEPGNWVSVQRDDGETVGYLDPVTSNYDVVVPRNILGQQIGEPSDYAVAEALVEDRGIGELMNLWTLDGQEAVVGEELTILEVSPDGIVLANALRVKALDSTQRIHIPWPDVSQRLTSVKRP